MVIADHPRSIDSPRSREQIDKACAPLGAVLLDESGIQRCGERLPARADVPRVGLGDGVAGASPHNAHHVSPFDRVARRVDRCRTDCRHAVTPPERLESLVHDALISEAAASSSSLEGL
jgi:hypothetical protein